MHLTNSVRGLQSSDDIFVEKLRSCMLEVDKDEEGNQFFLNFQTHIYLSDEPLPTSLHSLYVACADMLYDNRKYYLASKIYSRCNRENDFIKKIVNDDAVPYSNIEKYTHVVRYGTVDQIDIAINSFYHGDTTRKFHLHSDLSNQQDILFRRTASIARLLRIPLKRLTIFQHVFALQYIERQQMYDCVVGVLNAGANIPALIASQSIEPKIAFAEWHRTWSKEPRLRRSISNMSALKTAKRVLITDVDVISGKTIQHVTQSLQRHTSAALDLLVTPTNQCKSADEIKLLVPQIDMVIDVNSLPIHNIYSSILRYNKNAKDVLDHYNLPDPA